MASGHYVLETWDRYILRLFVLLMPQYLCYSQDSKDLFKILLGSSKWETVDGSKYCNEVKDLRRLTCSLKIPRYQIYIFMFLNRLKREVFLITFYKLKDELRPIYRGVNDTSAHVDTWSQRTILVKVKSGKNY